MTAMAERVIEEIRGLPPCVFAPLGLCVVESTAFFSAGAGPCRCAGLLPATTTRPARRAQGRHEPGGIPSAVVGIWAARGEVVRAAARASNRLNK